MRLLDDEDDGDKDTLENGRRRSELTEGEEKQDR